MTVAEGGFSGEEIARLRGDQINLAFFFRAVMPSGVVRLFAGAGDFPVGVDAIETEGGVYQSAGSWGDSLPDVDHLVNGQAQLVTFLLSGVSKETIRAYREDRREIVGAPAAFGWAVLDERYRPAGPIRWPLRGVLAQPRINRSRQGEAGETRIISVALMTGGFVRRRGLAQYLSGADHRRRHPGDLGCDRVGLYSAGTTRVWP